MGVLCRSLLRTAIVALAAPCVLVGREVLAISPDHLVPVEFSRTLDVGFGNSIFLLGDVAEAGGGVLPLGPKLAWTPGSVWRAKIALLPGAVVTCRYYSRKDGASDVGSPSNGTPIGDEFVTTVSQGGGSVPVQHKVLDCLTSWTAPRLQVEQADGTFAEFSMVQVGTGRTAGEGRWRVSGFGTPGRTVRFRLTDGTGQFEVPAAGGLYETPLDRILLQDRELFNYEPAPVVSSSRKETIPDVVSPQGLLPRTLRVYLPRGYDQHTTRRYPVLYMHDGQNLFGTSGSGFPPVRWNVDGTLDRLIRMGQVREVIVVGIDNTSDRITDYTPPGAPAGGLSNGRGDRYLAFVRETVKPLIDGRYRTLPDAANTALGGSSLGGLISTYMGLEAPGAFSKIAALSPAYWAHRGVMDRLNTEASLPAWRHYLDSGTAGPTAGGSPDGYGDCIEVRDRMLRRGQALNRDVLHVVGVGHEHNETAWQIRFPGTARFLLPIEDEPNGVADGSASTDGDWQLY